MKKVWNDAVLEELNITATAGGPNPAEVADSGIWQVDDHGQEKWVKEFGKS